MKRYYYSNSIERFLSEKPDLISGVLANNNEFSLDLTQREAWNYQINILKTVLKDFSGEIYFEFAIPRMGKRIDVVLLIKNVICVIEFKVGEKDFLSSAMDQVMDYALDLKNFHETSQSHLIAPILVATGASPIAYSIACTPQNDNILFPIKSNTETLKEIIQNIIVFEEGEEIDSSIWIKGRYSPTPTIIEAAMALYSKHGVANISRKDATAINLTKTSNTIQTIIRKAKKEKEKVICFVTGVPGAGKTLVGLNVATENIGDGEGIKSVLLSGNGPLVSILREALTRDKVEREKAKGLKIKKGQVLSEVKMFIQNIHHFRDECLRDLGPPIEHVAIFDEAQRAWNHQQTASFMIRKKNQAAFAYSEPEFLISCLDRHKDWAVIICLVGGGQEINTGEAGISEWFESLNRSFPDWKIYTSSKIIDTEYAAGEALEILKERTNVTMKDELHLSVSMRSFRAEHLASLVKNVLDLKIKDAKSSYSSIKHKYSIVLTRDLQKAKAWLKSNARGSERYGIVVSSQAQRLKPYAIDVKSPIDPVHWFLDGKDDVRSSFFMEDVATEFQVQGLELDWACVTWDADFRYSEAGWDTFSFVGDRWNRIKKEERKQYLKNAYRVLLTRARQGMVIVVPEGSDEDHTRKSEFYDNTFDYLKSIGFPII